MQNKRLSHLEDRREMASLKEARPETIRVGRSCAGNSTPLNVVNNGGSARNGFSSRTTGLWSCAYATDATMGMSRDTKLPCSSRRWTFNTNFLRHDAFPPKTVRTSELFPMPMASDATEDTSLYIELFPPPPPESHTATIATGLLLLLFSGFQLVWYYLRGPGCVAPDLKSLLH